MIFTERRVHIPEDRTGRTHTPEARKPMKEARTKSFSRIDVDQLEMWRIAKEGGLLRKIAEEIGPERMSILQNWYEQNPEARKPTHTLQVEFEQRVAYLGADLPEDVVGDIENPKPPRQNP